MGITRILVPTDFSDNAKEALDYAVELAKRSEATIHLLHVPRIPTYFVADIVYNPGPKIVTEILTYSQDAIDALQEDVQAGGISCETAVNQGTTHEVIARYVQDHDIELLIIGTHGRTGMSKLMYGSVTERVLKTVDVPILVIPPQGGRLPDSVVVAFDFSDPARNAAAAARAVHGAIPGAIHLVHTYLDVWAEYTDRGAAVGEPAQRRMEALRLGLTEMLEKEAEELFSIDSSAVQIHLVEGDASKGVLGIAKEVNADMICAGVTGKTGLERVLLGSVARKLLRESPVPVLFAHGSE